MLLKMGDLELVLSFNTVNSAETVTFANGEWAPYMSDKLKNSGYVSDIVVQAYKEEGIDVNWVFLPWKRGLEEANQKQIIKNCFQVGLMLYWKIPKLG